VVFAENKLFLLLVYIQNPTIFAWQTYFLNDPRLLPYKPVYKAIPSLTLGYLQKINSENLEHETKITKFQRENSKAFNGILSVKEKRYRTIYYSLFTKKWRVSVALVVNAVRSRLKGYP